MVEHLRGEQVGSDQTRAPPPDAGSIRAPTDLWIFGYGSLMWKPGFAFAEAHAARINGYHRCFCIYSTHHRGTPKRPGLVLGLDRGRSCDGMVFRVAPEQARTTLAYLRKREQINGVYREARVHVTLTGMDHRQIEAIAFIVERAHPSYTGQLPLVTQAHLIRGAKGLSGANLDYLINTVRQLRQMGLKERELERIVALAAPHAAHAHTVELQEATAIALRRVVARLPDDAPRMRPDQRRRFMYRGRIG
jgi:glutathione-specific gamma-glutamylcyclotransferase